MKKTIRVALLSLKNRIRSFDMIIVIIFLFTYFSFIFPSSCKNVIEAHENVNVFAPFINGFLLRDFKIITLLGLIMMLGAKNAVDSNKINVLMRVDKKEWYASEIFTMVFTCVIYAGVILIMSLLFYLPVITLTSNWGSGVESYSFFNNVLSAKEDMLQRNVFTVFFEAFVLVVLVELLLGAICLFSDTIGNKRMGPVICGTLLVWNLIVQATEWLPKVLSPIGMMTGYSQDSFLYSALYLLVLNAIVLNGIWLAGKKNDAI